MKWEVCLWHFIGTFCDEKCIFQIPHGVQKLVNVVTAADESVRLGADGKVGQQHISEMTQRDI